MSLTLGEAREAARWAKGLAYVLAQLGRQLHRVDEATSAAMAGLTDAIRNFEEAEGDPGERRMARLKRFAAKRVAGEIRDALNAGRRVDAFEIAVDDAAFGPFDEEVTPEQAVEGYVLGCTVEELHRDGEAGLLRREAYARLHRAVAQLPPEERRLLELHYWEDLPWSEVAQALGMPERTVGDHWLKLRVHLRKVLTTEDGVREAAPRGRVVPLSRPPGSRE
jgi:RNA polymerase sigma factor (sigma-70 family)